MTTRYIVDVPDETPDFTFRILDAIEPGAGMHSLMFLLSEDGKESHTMHSRLGVLIRKMQLP